MMKEYKEPIVYFSFRLVLDSSQTKKIQLYELDAN